VDALTVFGNFAILRTSFALPGDRYQDNPQVKHVCMHLRPKNPRWNVIGGLCLRVSPLVEDTAVDTVVIDIEGCELLFGSAYELANEIANRATKSREASGLGCRVNVAVASNPDAAIHAARLF